MHLTLTDAKILSLLIPSGENQIFLKKTGQANNSRFIYAQLKSVEGQVIDTCVTILAQSRTKKTLDISCMEFCFVGQKFSRIFQSQ